MDNCGCAPGSLVTKYKKRPPGKLTKPGSFKKIIPMLVFSGKKYRNKEDNKVNKHKFLYVIPIF